MAAKYKTYGVQLSRKNAAAFDLIPNLLEVKPPNETCETLDVTTHDSIGGYKEFVTTFKNGGTCTATFMFDPANAIQTALHGDFVGTTKNTYKVITTAGSPFYYFTFDAYITEWAPSNMSVDGKMEVAVTLTVTGPVSISNT